MEPGEPDAREGVPHKKRILYIEHSVDGTIGGSYHSLLYLIKHLDKTRYEPLVLFYRNHPLVPEFLQHASRVLFMRKPRGVNIAQNLFQQGKRSLNIFILPLLLYQKLSNFVARLLIPAVRCAKFLRANKIMLVHLNNSVLHGQEWVVAAKLTGTKCVIHQRGYGYGRDFNRPLSRLVDAIICVSEDIKRDLQRLGVSRTRKLVAIHNGIDTEDVHSPGAQGDGSVRKEFGLCNSSRLIGIIANIKEWKGQHVVVQALPFLLETHKHLRCFIVGEVSDSAEDREFYRYLSKLVRDKELGGIVIFTGYRSDVYRIMAALDVIVHASIQPEPFGRVLLEGMAIGKPVIATDLGGPREIIEHGVSGLLIPPGDPVALARAADQLLRDEVLATRMGRCARRRVEGSFSARQVARKVESVYESLFVHSG